ncbi:MAG: hypothetical protein HY296_08380 [Thaumarchaeota archaeon]|nr:hypothetical protein [Nitrososphaerota archaeon]
MSAIDDTAIRSYYSYQLLEELIQAQRKGLFDLASTIIGALAGVVGVIEYIQLPTVSFEVGVTTVVVVVGVVVAWFLLRRRFSGKAMAYGVYLGILLDEISKYSRHVEILQTCQDKASDVGNLFLKRTAEVLRTSRKQIDDLLCEIGSDRLGEALKDFGLTREGMDRVLADADRLLG